MANNVKYKVQLDFTTNKPSLQNIQSQLKQVLNVLESSTELNLALDKDDIARIKRETEALSTAIASNFSKNTGKINFTGVKTSLDSMGVSANKLQAEFKELGIDGAASLNKIARAGYDFEKPIKETNAWVQKLNTSLVNTFTWSISSSFLNSISGQFQKAYFFAKDLDRSLTDIKIVSGQTSDQLTDFTWKANAAAKALRTSTIEYTDASLVYFQQGLSSIDVEKMTKATIIGANIAGESTEEMSTLLTATMNGYKLSADQALMVTDKLAAVGAKTAADFYELATAMSKVSSMANAAGIPMDQLNAQLATIVSVTKEAPEAVGTSLKTIYGRMLAFRNDAKGIMLDEEGEMFSAPSVETALQRFNAATGSMISLFDILPDGSKDLRNMGDVIHEIGEAWQDTTDLTAKFGLATALAGSRQQNRLIALFDAWDMYEDAMQTSMDAEGTALKQNLVYMDSYQAKLKELQVATETAYLGLLTSDTMKGFIGALTTAVELSTNMVSALGGLPAILGIITTMLGKSLMSKNVEKFINTLSNKEIYKGTATSKTDQKESKYNQQIGVIERSYSPEVVANIKATTKALLDRKRAIEAEQFQLKNSYKAFTEMGNLSKNIAFKDDKFQLVDADKITRDLAKIKTSLGGNLTSGAVTQIKLLEKELTLATSGKEIDMKRFSVLYQKTMQEIANSTKGTSSKIKNASDTLQLEMAENERRLSIQEQTALRAQKLSSAVTILAPAITATMKVATDDMATSSDALKAFGSVAGVAGFIAVQQFTSMAASAGVLKGALMALQTSFLPMLAVIGVVAAIGGVIKLVDNLSTTAEEASKSLTKFNSELSTLTSKKKELDTIATALDALSKKSFLSTDEMEKYVNLQNQLGELMPELVAGRDAEGNAILNVNNNYQGLLKNLDAEIKKKRELAAQEAINRLQSVGKDFGEARGNLKKAETSAAEGKNINSSKVIQWQKDVESAKKEFLELSYVVAGSVSTMLDGAESFDVLSSSARDYIAQSFADKLATMSKDDAERFSNDYMYRAQIYADFYTSLEDIRTRYSSNDKTWNLTSQQSFNDYALSVKLSADSYAESLSLLESLQTKLNESSQRMSAIQVGELVSELDAKGIELTEGQTSKLNGTLEDQRQVINELISGKEHSAEADLRMRQSQLKLNIATLTSLNLKGILNDTIDDGTALLEAQKTELDSVTKELEIYGITAEISASKLGLLEQQLANNEDRFTASAEALGEYESSNSISFETLNKLIELYPEFEGHLGDQATLVKALKGEVKREADLQRKIMVEKLMNSENYYKTLSSANLTYYAELLGLQQSDLENVKTLNGLIEQVQEIHLKNMLESDKQYYKARKDLIALDLDAQIALLEASSFDGMSDAETSLLNALKRARDASEIDKAKIESLVLVGKGFGQEKAKDPAKLEQQDINVKTLANTYKDLEYQLDRIKDAYNRIDPTDTDALNKNLRSQQSMVAKMANVARLDIATYVSALNESMPSHQLDMSKLFKIDENNLIQGFKEGGLAYLLTWQEQATERFPALESAAGDFVGQIQDLEGSLTSLKNEYPKLGDTIVENLKKRSEEAAKSAKASIDSLTQSLEKSLTAEKDRLSKIKENAESTFSQIKKALDDEKQGYEDLITIQEELFEPRLKAAQDEIDAFETKLDLEERIAEQKKIELELIKAQLNLTNAQNEKNTRIINTNEQWEWVANPKEIRDALEQLTDAEEDKKDYLNEVERERLEANKTAIEKELEEKIKVYQLEINSIDRKSKELESIEFASYAERQIKLDEFVSKYNISIESILEDTEILRIEEDLKLLKSNEEANYATRLEMILTFVSKYNQALKNLGTLGEIQGLSSDAAVKIEKSNEYNGKTSNTTVADAKVNNLTSANQIAYLEGLKKTGSENNKKWANNQLYLIDLVKNGTEGNKAWATQKLLSYDTGGMLGSGSMGINLSGKPERILNPEQTEAFNKLVSYLPKLIQDNGISNQFQVSKSLGAQLSSIVSSINLNQSSTGSNISYHFDNMTVKANHPEEFLKEIQNIANLGFRR